MEHLRSLQVCYSCAIIKARAHSFIKAAWWGVQMTSDLGNWYSLRLQQRHESWASAAQAHCQRTSTLHCFSTFATRCWRPMLYEKPFRVRRTSKSACLNPRDPHCLALCSVAVIPIKFLLQ